MKKARDTVSAGRFTLQTAYGVVVGVAVLYLAREVLIPIALAILLSFLLSPPMVRLQRLGFRKSFAALTVVALSSSFVALLCWVLFSQAYNLSADLPAYRNNITTKLRSLAPRGLDHLAETQQMLTDVGAQLTKSNAPKAPASQRPVAVEVRPPAPTPLAFLQRVVGPVASVVAMTFAVLLFVIFILIEREDLRDRVLRLAGSGRLYVTTQVLDDAANRVSRYLLTQLAVNTVYGVLVGLALRLLGVPHPLVWAVLAALLRFIPYVGPWIAAAGPLLLAVGAAPGWEKFGMTLGLYVVLELITGNVVEPFLYGSSTGISPVAILVAAVFWTWLWGPIGLLLSTPLTVCVVVVGRHVRHLEFLGILFGDEPALSPAQRFYQRMIAMEAEDAAELAEEFLKEQTVTDVYDTVIAPALSLVEEGRLAGFLDLATETYVLENTRELIQDFAETNIAAAERGEKSVKIVCLPAKNAFDELACQMFTQLLVGCDVQILPVDLPGVELANAVRAAQPDLICVAGIPPQAVRRVAIRCRQLRRACPSASIMAAVWSDADLATIRERIPVSDANHVACTLKQGLDYIREITAAPAVVDNTVTDGKDAAPRESAAEEIADLQLLAGSEGTARETLDEVLSSLTKALDAPMGFLKITDEAGTTWTAQRGVPSDLSSALLPVTKWMEAPNGNSPSEVLIRDVLGERRFTDLGLANKGIAFCAGQRLLGRNGKMVGEILVLDTRKRELTDHEEQVLGAAAVAVVEALEVTAVAPGSEAAADHKTIAHPL